ncbi:MAG: class I SAM-dependent methyltransferase [Bacteroidetes bacterium]|nr:class I SAM-dependent methyltransferase [Bacteroidota bacterium]
MKHQEMKYEYMKYHKDRPLYEAGIKEMKELGFSDEEYFNHFPCFIGHLTLSRYLALYEAFKLSLNVAGHIAEIGVDKGSVSLLFTKLVKIFEPNSLTLVHGFDWFQGTKPTSEESFLKAGTYKTDELVVNRLVKANGLENIIHIHNLDATKDFPDFFNTPENAHLQFKLVFLDCGIYQVVAESIKTFWNRLTPGGLLVLDHYSFEQAPGEIRAIRELLPHVKFKQFPFGWMPAAYAIKD